MPFSSIDANELMPGQTFLCGGPQKSQLCILAIFPDGGAIKAISMEGKVIRDIVGRVLLVHKPMFLPDMMSFGSSPNAPLPGSLMLIDESMFIIVTVPDPHAITGIGTGLLDIATGEIKHARNIDYYGTFSSWSVVSVDGYEHGDELYRYTSKAA